MRLPLLIVLLTLMSPWDRLWAQTDPFVGNWRWVRERSRSAPGGTLPKDIKRKIVVENGKLREESESIQQDGSSRVLVFILEYDGKEHPVEAAADAVHRKHTILWKRIDDHTIEGRINHDDGKLYTTLRLVVSPDGSELTQTGRGQSSDGTPVETLLTFVRQ
jgi:hypothetical protein